MALILAIDDDRKILELLRAALTREGHRVETADDGRQGLRRFQELRPELVITDLMMPEREGIETIRILRALDAKLRILAISGQSRGMPGSFLEAASRLGADGTLAKPFAADELCETVRELLERPPA